MNLCFRNNNNSSMYRQESINKLKNSICKNCIKKAPDWDNDTYVSWIRYINGRNRKELIKNTRFSSYISLKYHLKKHQCYKKIAKPRKHLFRRAKTKVKRPIINYPWLLGLYYADGFIRNKSQLAFGLSLHEKIIANKVIHNLREILGRESHIVEEKIGNMI